MHDEILRCEDDHLANVFPHAVMAVLLLDEKLQQTFFGNIRADVRWVDSRTGLVDGVLVQVGGKHLQGEAFVLLESFHRLLEDDGEGIGFLTRRAASHPGSQHTPVGVRC